MQSLGQTTNFRPERSDWLRLRTLIVLRWTAIAGQFAAITVAHAYLGFQLPLGLCYLAVGAAIIANLVAIYVFPRNKRLAEYEAMLILMFDLSQLSFLLFLTGGLANPFALLILAPVTVSASALELRSTFALGALSILFITLTAFFNMPLMLADGSILRLPIMFEVGFWLSIVIGIAFLGLYARRIATEMHSMSDALLATQMGLRAEAVVSIAAPSRILTMLRLFARYMGLPAQARAHFVRLVEEKAGMPAGHLDVARYQLDFPGLIVHAADDPVVPYSEAQAIHEAWFDSRLLRLEQGGHQRLLSDPQLVQAVMQLLAALRQTSSSELAS